MRKRFDTPEAERLEGSQQPERRGNDSSIRPKVGTYRGRVLVIDDSEDVRRVVSATLEVHGFDVLLAQDGEEGLAFYRVLHAAIDAVLVDIEMPGMDGIETFRRLQLVNPQVRAILWSGGALSRRIDEALRQGALAFLRKPFVPEVLIDEINRAIGAIGDTEEAHGNCNDPDLSRK